MDWYRDMDIDMDIEMGNGDFCIAGLGVGIFLDIWDGWKMDGI